MSCLSFLALTFLLNLLLLPLTTRAATLDVPSKYATIQAGVDAAQSGDTVLVADGIYTGDGNRDIDLGGKNLAVMSQHGATSTIIDCGGGISPDGSGSHRGFYIHRGEQNVVIEGFTVKNGYQSAVPDVADSGSGGGIAIHAFNYARIAVTDCVLTGNRADFGGGISHNNDSGVITLNGCTVAGNAARSDGGGIETGFNRSGGIVLVNCTVFGNSAGARGGGVFSINDYNGTVALTNCTITGNAAADGGGVYTENYSRISAVTLTNCIVYGSAGGEVSSRINGDTVNFCDVRYGMTGLSNINVDPQFVDAAHGDLHLQPSSGCLGAGTRPSAPTVDKDGHTRPNPPSIGAYDAALIPVGETHILWTSADGRLSLWNADAEDGTFTEHTYGPYPGWTAQALADGPDTLTRVLWTHSDGRISLWRLNSAAGTFTEDIFGPYPGWTAKAVSVSPNNTTHLLWANTDGRLSLWNTDTAGHFTERTYGPYPGWSAQAIADGGDGLRVLWDNTNGAASFWSLDNAAGTFTENTYGPYPGWTADALSVSRDTTHILWNNSDGRASLWNYQALDGTFTQNTYGPYPGWRAQAVADGADGKTRLLWDNTNGMMSLWSLDSAAGTFIQHAYGPYSGWTARAVSAP